MKPLFLLAASAFALSATACAKTPGPRAALDCPETQGALTRTSVAADGKSCTYASRDGGEVSLRLTPVSGGAYATLDAMEASLLAERSAAATKVDTAVDSSPTKDTTRDAQKVAAEAASDAQRSSSPERKAGVDIRVDEDGRTIVDEEGGTTRVRLPGIQVEADEAKGSANVRIGPLSVNAGDTGATVRVRRDVRMKGEAFAREKRGLRATFISTDDAAPEGYRIVGFEAAGPKTGPLAVAVVKGNEEFRDGDHLYRDVRRLVRRNGGV